MRDDVDALRREPIDRVAHAHVAAVVISQIQLRARCDGVNNLGDFRAMCEVGFIGGDARHKRLNGHTDGQLAAQ